ncbi:GNAT family N-acetyltransferase [Aestuariivirga sp.]|jgi:GNAT superfamily N-acetyltransferase|uniref:GNAT family N-acetyltransferase n=1 Tax=Aestuariivirga sp. TaxID=2650926 RepID=UPI00378387A4
MKIRRITRRDMPVLCDMVVEFERMLARMEGKRCRIDAQKTGTSLAAAGFGGGRFFDGLIALENGVAQGYLLYHFGFNTQHYCGTLVISDFFVRQGARRQGAGRALFQRAQDIARARGCRRMEWTVWNINAPAIAFYRAMGAEAVSDELPMGLAIGGKPQPAGG